MIAHELVGNIDAPPALRGASGITFHPRRKTLFAVSDRGELAEIRPDGTKVRQRRFSRADLEGITLDPASDRLYAVWEGPERIVEIDVETWQLLREFEVERTFNGRTVFSGGDNHGLEAIAFVPDPKDPDGGTFFVSNQSPSLKKKSEPSVLVRLRVPLRSAERRGGLARILNVYSLGVADLAGCCFDARSGHLFVVSDDENLLLEVDLDGRVLKRGILPGNDQEGIVLDDQGFLYVAQDSGGIIKMKFLGFK
ncbi:MAG: SdiA-regulated domain-containing protein [Kiritimatiellae bacterium]|nr:SdiA-regulated domain-containing protein [Kiritimatiellia bacterium]